MDLSFMWRAATAIAVPVEMGAGRLSHAEVEKQAQAASPLG